MRTIAKKFGGDFECEHGMQPKMDAETREVLNWILPSALLPLGP